MIKKINRYNKTITITILCLFCLISLVIAVNHPRYLNDDSFITLTYVKNLVNGNGFVFNTPPPVLGTTTPLFTFLVAGLSFLFPFISIPSMAIYLTAICWLGIPWLLYWFRENWGLRYWHLWILALVNLASGMVNFLGMEAYLFAFLLVLSLSLLFSERYLLSGIVIGLLFLTRGEGVLIVGVGSVIILINYFKESGLSFNWAPLKKIMKITAGFFGTVSIWAVYALLTFGTVLPNTLSAKQAQGYSGGGSFITRMLNQWIQYWGRSLSLPGYPLINFWWPLVGIGLIYILLRKSQWLAFVGWIALYTVGYEILGVAPYWWYQLPVLFVFNILFAFGLIAVIELFNIFLKKQWIVYSLSVLMVALFIYRLGKPTFNMVRNYQGDDRGRSYVQLSQWFVANSTTEKSIAYAEIGYLGFFTDNQIIDLLGLVIPDIVPHIAEGDVTWGFWHYEPDYYVYLPDFDWLVGEIYSDPRFEQLYEPAGIVPGPRETDFVIYERKK